MRPHIIRSSIFSLLSLVLLISLSGCLHSPQTPQAAPSGQQEESHWANNAIPPEENRAFSIPSISWYSSENGKGFYVPDCQLLYYYDPESHTKVPLCSQSGCTHSSESCEAWLAAEPQGFVSYGDVWYVISVEESTHAVLWKIDHLSHQRTKLCDIAPQNDQDNYYFSSGYVAHGYAYLNLNHQLIWEEQVVEEPSLIRVNLTDGAVETLVEDMYVSFLGAGENRVLLAVETFAVPPLSKEEYLKQHPDGNYHSYLQVQLAENGSGGTELREYTSDMSSYQVLANGNVWVSSTQYLCRYGDYTLYAVDNTLYIYDFSTGESRQVVNESSLRNFLIIDKQVIFLIYHDGYTIYRTHVDGGPIYQFENKGMKDGAVFSVSGESQYYIYGPYRSDENVFKGIISKEDFFAERYENVTPIF